MAKKKILITGPLGHIGSHLIHTLDPELISEIILLDNLESQRFVSLFNLPTTISYRFIFGDVRDFDFLPLISQVDVVIHLAALTNAEGTVDRAAEVEAINFGGLKRVADACLQAGVPLLFPSTTSVYGSQESKVDETCADLLPQSPYAASKLQAEQYLQSLQDQGLKFIICRFGTIFGRSIGMRFHTAVNKFIWQAVTGQPISVWKTAWEQRRPYLYLGDCGQAIDLIIRQEIFDGQIYNIVTDNFSVEQVVTTIQEFVPQLQKQFVDSRIMNQLSYDVSGQKFQALGFEPKGNLKKGIGETVEQLKCLIN